MTPSTPKPKTIQQYIDAAPPETQAKLHQLNACIHKAAPGAEEGLKWSMPAYSMDKILVTFALYKKHIGLAVMESAIKAFAEGLEGYETTSGSIKFPLDKPLPLPLISKIVKFRVKENKDGTIKWKS